MKSDVPLVVFRLDRQRYAVLLRAVERIIRAVEVTRLPNAPGTVLGIIDMEGRVLPVLDVRRKLSLPAREITPSDHFLIASTSQRSVVFVVDDLQGVVEQPEASIVDTTQIFPGLVHIRNAAQSDDGLILIQDLEKFFSTDEVCILDEALAQYGTGR